jgi:hypothetical protein
MTVKTTFKQFRLEVFEKPTLRVRVKTSTTDYIVLICLFARQVPSIKLDGCLLSLNKEARHLTKLILKDILLIKFIYLTVQSSVFLLAQGAMYLAFTIFAECLS